MEGKFAPLEQYLRGLPMAEEEVTLTFERVEEILKDRLPASAHEDRP